MVVLGAMTAFEGVVSTCARFPPFSAGTNCVIALGLRSVRFPAHPIPFQIVRKSGKPNSPQCAITARQALWARTAYQTHRGRTRAGKPPASQHGDLLTGACSMNGALWSFPKCSGSPTAAPAPPPFSARLSVAPIALCALSGGFVSLELASLRAAVCAGRLHFGSRRGGD
jgi:hypothetical protein